MFSHIQATLSPATVSQLCSKQADDSDSWNNSFVLLSSLIQQIFSSYEQPEQLRLFHDSSCGIHIVGTQLRHFCVVESELEKLIHKTNEQISGLVGVAAQETLTFQDAVSPVNNSGDLSSNLTENLESCNYTSAVTESEVNNAGMSTPVFNMDELNFFSGSDKISLDSLTASYVKRRKHSSKSSLISELKPNSPDVHLMPIVQSERVGSLGQVLLPVNFGVRKSELDVQVLSSAPNVLLAGDVAEDNIHYVTNSPSSRARIFEKNAASFVNCYSIPGRNINRFLTGYRSPEKYAKETVHLESTPALSYETTPTTMKLLKPPPARLHSLDLLASAVEAAGGWLTKEEPSAIQEQVECYPSSSVLAEQPKISMEQDWENHRGMLEKIFGSDGEEGGGEGGGEDGDEVFGYDTFTTTKQSLDGVRPSDIEANQRQHQQQQQQLQQQQQQHQQQHEQQQKQQQHQQQQLLPLQSQQQLSEQPAQTMNLKSGRKRGKSSKVLESLESIQPELQKRLHDQHLQMEKINEKIVFLPTKSISAENKSRRGERLTRQEYERLMEDKFMCRECSYRSKRYSAILKHVLSKHATNPDNSMLTCDRCDFTAKSSNYLLRHKKSRHPEFLEQLLPSDSSLINKQRSGCSLVERCTNRKKKLLEMLQESGNNKKRKKSDDENYGVDSQCSVIDVVGHSTDLLNPVVDQQINNAQETVHDFKDTGVVDSLCACATLCNRDDSKHSTNSILDDERTMGKLHCHSTAFNISLKNQNSISKGNVVDISSNFARVSMPDNTVLYTCPMTDVCSYTTTKKSFFMRHLQLHRKVTMEDVIQCQNYGGRMFATFSKRINEEKIMREESSGQSEQLGGVVKPCRLNVNTGTKIDEGHTGTDGTGAEVNLGQGTGNISEEMEISRSEIESDFKIQGTIRTRQSAIKKRGNTVIQMQQDKRVTVLSQPVTGLEVLGQPSDNIKVCVKPVNNVKVLDESTDNLQVLGQHENNSDEKNSIEIENMTELSNHMDSVNEINGTVKEDILYVDLVSEHMCPVCECYKTHNRDHMIKHIRISHCETRSHLCDNCGASFKTNHHLRRHERNKHNKHW